MAYGRWFEEFTVGEVIRHWPGRTITEADCTWFALLTMNQHPVHSDAHYAATHTQHGQRLVLGPLVFSIGIGMTSGKAIANLEIERITHEAPTFIGDTIYSESTVLAVRESRQGDRGTVSVETRVTNQRGERVMTFRRTALVPTRTHATLGAHAGPPAPRPGSGAPEPGPPPTRR
jgi:acyl dehydratase